MPGLSREELTKALSDAWNARGDDMRANIARLADELNGQSVTTTELPMVLVTLSSQIAATMVTQMANSLIEVIAANNEALMKHTSTPEQ